MQHMFDFWEKHHKHPFVQQFRDVRVLGQVVFGIVVLLVSWSGVQAIQSNFELQKQIAELENENAVYQLENENLRLRNQYYETDRFLELAARRQFGKAAPGETLLIVPRSVALANAPDIPMPKQQAEQDAPPSSLPWYQKNFQAWMDFFFHRPPSS